ncbi:DEAD/DEAH box helicase [Alkalicoccus halolimnae]|uniref:DEAD/DEAH box helicase n=1 Tax=Alkalicoccus halolimnae TaxID=1667239 RepID=A0A5C7F6J6_9BACI|nr:DEAD/DEAH box helicase [Alkalicoccus halolimnae]TXF85633.1 DEAD/DEAH box helicase [Alkalicoccus halolimnae]
MSNTFEQFQLSGEIREALAGMKYEQATEVQSLVIPRLLEGSDVIVKAKTGSGKTAAFAVPMCEKAVWEENKPQALVLTPTRELAMQVKEDIQNIGRFKRLKAALLVGQQPAAPQRVELNQKVHIVTGTPGRVLDHIEKGTLNLENVKYVVLDEADEMLNMGFIDQVEHILAEVPKERITSLFSATLPQKVIKLSEKYMNEPEIIETVLEEKPHIDFTWLETSRETKIEDLYKFLVKEQPESAVLFCNQKDMVDELTSYLKDRGLSCDKIHGGLEQKERTQVMEEFKRGTTRYLIASDVAARGIDVLDMPLVINVDVPIETEKFIHRTGRTARAGKEGKAVTFVIPQERRYADMIGRRLKTEVDLEPVPFTTALEEKSFQQKMNEVPQLKKDKSAPLEKNITKLYFNGGKKKKLRAFDFVGTITSIPGIEADDIGIITVESLATYVDILNGKGSVVLQDMQERKVKGKNLKVREARR